MCRKHVNRTGAEVQAVHAFDDLPLAPADGWTPPVGTLGELVRLAEARAREVAASQPALEAQAASLPAPPPFRHALRGPRLRVIAEVKRASPSKGAIAPGLDAAAQARAYEAGGAAAISVLTEPSRFGGGLDDLAAAAAAVRVPVLRKDFIVHAVQIWEARVHGAAAVLLIARALSPASLGALYAEAQRAGLEVLVEVRDAAELATALDIGATVIGVNNRNLETLHIDPATAPALIPSIPGDRIAIAESGMATVGDASASQRAGADALLIGSAISASADPATAVAAFAALERVGGVRVG
jgi:indole-3-glycerol phosphate synthase